MHEDSSLRLHKRCRQAFSHPPSSPVKPSLLHTRPTDLEARYFCLAPAQAGFCTSDDDEASFARRRSIMLFVNICLSSLPRVLRYVAARGPVGNQRETYTGAAYANNKVTCTTYMKWKIGAHSILMLSIVIITIIAENLFQKERPRITTLGP